MNVLKYVAHSNLENLANLSKSSITMPAFKLTKELFVESKVDKSLVDSVKAVAEEESCIQAELLALVALLKAENAREQIDCLKKVLQFIKKKIDSAQMPEPKVKLALQFLVHLFFVSTSKNPLRRVLVSYFQGLTVTLQENEIKPAIVSSLVAILNQPIRRAEDSNQPIRFEESQDLRHDVDTLSALLENFPLGEECLISQCLKALGYLGQAQEHFYFTYSDHLSPVQQNETMHNCLETVKVANRICQRSTVVLETKVRDTGSNMDVSRVARNLLEMDVCILKSEEFLLDCRTTSAMNIALWLRTLFGQDDKLLLQYLLKTVFKGFQSQQYEQLCDWPECLDLSQLEKSLLSDSAYLCLCYGFLSMLSSDTMLTKFDDKRCLLIDVLLPELLALNKRCQDVGSKLLAAKSVCLLCQRLSQYMKNNREDCEPELLSRLNGESQEITEILDYIWTSWEDSVDAIRFTVRDTFEHVVTVHLYSSHKGTNAVDDPFLLKLTKSIITEVSWSCKGKYGTLAVLVSHLGSTRMLELHSGIADDVLLQLKEQTLACYASDLYEKLFSSHMTELSSLKSDWLETWWPCWIDPVLRVLCGNNKTQKKHVIEYVLPKLLKTGSAALHYIISQLSSGSINDGVDRSIRGHQLGAMIVCLRRARALGQLQGLSNRAERRLEKERKSKAKKGTSKNKTTRTATDSDHSEVTGRTDQSDQKDTNQSAVDGDRNNQSGLWYGVVDVEVLRQALSSKDEQVRLDAFALLCENQKTTEVVSDLELDLIEGFIPYNLNNQMPSFRQHFLSHLKKLLSRMKESFAVLKRIYMSSKDTEAAQSMVRYKEFLSWLKQCLCSSLFPGSVFARRTTCLGGLTLLMEIYGDKRIQGQTLEEEFTFFEVIDRSDVQKLLHCLTDTFEDNKREAADILIACSSCSTAKGVLDENETKNLFQIALTLSSSTRPQDSTTAAYLLKVLLHQQNILKVMEEQETSHHRKYSESGNEAPAQNEADESEKFYKYHSNKNDLLEGRSLKIKDLGDNSSGRCLYLLVVLLNSLQEQVDVARNNLIVAAANCPLYPTMQCMRYCLADIDFRAISESQKADWKAFLSQLITICLKISEIVSPVVHNSSPEGNIPVDAIKATGLKMSDLTFDQSEDRISRSHETVMLMPEYLVVCCWRSVKEISLILGQLTKDVPISDKEDGCGGLLSHEQILDIGSYFTTQLLESKHRGAFELAYAGFVKVTEMLWRSTSKELHKLPREWLNTVMNDIMSCDPDSRLCATRRSAGVPFYIQALVTTEPVSTGRLCFKETMEELLALAFDDTLDTVEKSTSKVHALNILRAMFKDTRLGDDVAPFVADGLKVAVLGFKSPLWAVRNSATLLMSAMMVRIFGVKRSKDETCLSRKNCQTGRTFFHRYPSLYQFLLDQLAESTVAMETGNSFHLHPALYPILMVLGHLFPSAMEGTDTTLNLMAFIPFVMKCSHSPVLKTRVMAARALQPLVDRDHVTSVFGDLLSLLPYETFQGWQQNHVHGLLLQIKQLLKIVPTLSSSSQQELGSRIVLKWMDRCGLLMSRVNPCLLTRKEALEISAEMVISFGLHGYENDMTNLMNKILLNEITNFDENFQKHVPGLSDFKVTLCKLSLKLLQNWQKCEISDSKLSINSGNESQKNEGELVLLKENDNISQNIKDKASGSLAERIILKLLNSSLYEVRKCVLEIMKYCLLQKQVSTLQKHETEDLSGEMNQWEYLLSCDEVDYLFEVVSASGRIYGELVNIALLKETYHECLTEVFSVLQLHPLSVAQGQSQVCSSSVEEKNDKDLKYACKKIKSIEEYNCFQIFVTVRNVDGERELSDKVMLFPFLKDEVLTALIGYSGCLVRKLIQEINNLQRERTDNKFSNPSASDQIQKKLVLIEKWASVIQSNCGTEQNSDKQLACVKVIAENANHFLCDRDNILGILTFTFWKILIDLIQEDDLEVKDTAAGILAVVDNSFKATVHPYLALDFLIGQLLCCHGNSKKRDCISFLIGLIAEDTDDSEDFEERLFDRGEMNTYREPIDFIQLIDKHLSKFLRGEYPGQITPAPTRETIAEFPGKLTVEGTQFDIKEREWLYAEMMRIIQAVEKAIPDLGSLNAKAEYLNTSTYNKQMLNIYRGLTLLKYGLILPVEGVCRAKPVDLWKKVRVVLTENQHIGDFTKHLVTTIEDFV